MRNTSFWTERVNTPVRRTVMPRDFRGHGRTWLQFFADEGGDAGSGEDTPDDKTDGDGGSEKDKKPEGKTGKEDSKRTYDDAEVDRIVAKHKAEWEKAHAKEVEDAKEEARKYERMSKEQREEADRKKAADEAAKKDARIKELEAQIANDALRKSVASDVEAMPEGIKASQDFLDLVVTGDADMAKKNVQKLINIILSDRKAQEEKRATGRTPKATHGNSDVTNPYERVAAKYKK